MLLKKKFYSYAKYGEMGKIVDFMPRKVRRIEQRFNFGVDTVIYISIKYIFGSSFLYNVNMNPCWYVAGAFCEPYGLSWDVRLKYSLDVFLKL